MCNWQPCTLQDYFKVSQRIKLKVESCYPELSALVLSYGASLCPIKWFVFVYIMAELQCQK